MTTTITRNRSQHRPPHLFWGNYFFITGRCLNRTPYFASHDRKSLFCKVLQTSAKKFTVNFYAWALLDNHYHLLMKIKNSKNLLGFVKNLHANSSRLLNNFDGVAERQVWHQYWDHCIRDEKDFWKHFNYIHHNPVKHGIVNAQTEAAEYQFCSYRGWAQRKGTEWLESGFEQYPIVDFTAGE